jgi:hypothetical protein
MREGAQFLCPTLPITRLCVCSSSAVGCSSSQKKRVQSYLHSPSACESPEGRTKKRRTRRVTSLDEELSRPADGNVPLRTQVESVEPVACSGMCSIVSPVWPNSRRSGRTGTGFSRRGPVRKRSAGYLPLPVRRVGPVDDWLIGMPPDTAWGFIARNEAVPSVVQHRLRRLTPSLHQRRFRLRSGPLRSRSLRPLVRVALGSLRPRHG